MGSNSTFAGSPDPRAGGGAGMGASAIMRDPRFSALVKKRNGLALTLTVVTMAAYLAFIFLVAFDKPLLATKVGGGTTSLGIVLGLVIIVLAFIVTAIYVGAANGSYDRITAELQREYDR